MERTPPHIPVSPKEAPLKKIAALLVLALLPPAVAFATAEAALPAATVEAALAAPPVPPPAEGAFATDAQKVGYALGQQIGRQLKGSGFEFDLPTLAASIGDALEGRPSRMSQEEIMKTMTGLQEAAQKKEGAKMETMRKAAKFNAENGERIYQEALKQPGVTKTASGLAYQVITQGAGAKPSATDRVRVHYRGTFTDGTEFDSSYGRGEPAEFPLNGVIKGWTEGVQLMAVGSKFKFWIPADLAYGPANPDNPRPTGVLMFEVELLDILK